MLRVWMEIDGQVLVDRTLSRFAEDMKAPITELELGEPVAQDLREIVDDRFQNDGFGKWPELAPSTLEEKRREWGSFAELSVLVESGDLKRSLTRKGAKGAVLDIQPDELTVGTTIRYARFHQTGTRRMPARTIYDLREQDKRKLMRTIHRQAVRYSKRKLGYVQTDIEDFE
ncbi:MAG: phage virion morphogenesis protein [Acidobacteria bacterium]|nr:phage virion morphogenesis protein [Acidobacteriota bacterium]